MYKIVTLQVNVHVSVVTGFEKFNYDNPHYGTFVRYKIHSTGEAMSYASPGAIQGSNTGPLV